MPSTPYTPDIAELHYDVPADMQALPNMPEGWNWRPGQRALTQRIVNSTKKIVILQAEPGIGKTTIAVAAIKSMRARGLIMVKTRQLEHQYLNDFPDIRMMQGRRHYDCILTGKKADSAPCAVGYDCPHKGKMDWQTRQVIEWPKCDYFNAKLTAARAPISIHNYAYWINETRGARSMFATSDVIVCDEAHELQTIMMDSEEIGISVNELAEQRVPPMPVLVYDDGSSDGSYGLIELRDWARSVSPDINTRLEILTQAAKEGGLMADLDENEYTSGGDGNASSDDEDPADLVNVADSYIKMQEIEGVRRLQDLASRVGDLARLTDAECNETYPNMKLDNIGTPANPYVEWILDQASDKRDGGTLHFKPTFGKRGFRRLVASARTKIILMSAYLAPELLKSNLGITDDECEVIEADGVFDRTKSPVYFCPTYRLNFRTTDAEHARIVGFIDAVIRYHAPSSGLIHVPSVALRNTVMARSVQSNLMITYDGAVAGNSRFDPVTRRGTLDKDEALAQFKLMGAKQQRVLLGQSISTGVDIPYIPQWQIIYKLAFPSITDVATKARSQQDKAFQPFLVICELVQAVGRIKRAQDHDGPTYILDDQFSWFYAANRQHFPKWFTDHLIRNGWDRVPAELRTAWQMQKTRMIPVNRNTPPRRIS